MMEQETNPLRHAIRTFLIIIGLFLLYGIAVQVTEIDLQKLQTESRQEQVTGVLRFLADPNFTDPDLLDKFLGDATESFSWTETTIDTADLILETIFMALMATTIGTVLAVPISFLAARNLMVEITSPLAAIMLGIVCLPIGGWAGWFIASQLIGLGVTLSSSAILGLIIFVAAGVIMGILSRLGPPLVAVQKRPWSQTALAIGRVVLILAFALLAIGALTVTSHTAGLWLRTTIPWLAFMGSFLVVFSDIFQLLLAPIIGLICAFAAASLGSRYGQEAVLKLEGWSARFLTAVFTFAGTFVFVYGVGSALDWLYLFDYPRNWTLYPGLIGGAILSLISLFLAPKQPFRIGGFIYALTRGVLNIIRSIEPLIMAVIFVVWVGLGPFAGVMALTLHTIAALGKLFSEQIEGISDGPIEAINATGANRLQMITFAVIPQIVPLYIAYTLYRWDINVR
ncbi:MAG: ABC transporter permease subunit, partial [Anaerolineales bacterium]|nr:ABC transporter permease subunit [Anaerolineales bacterium]